MIFLFKNKIPNLHTYKSMSKLFTLFIILVLYQSNVNAIVPNSDQVNNLDSVINKLTTKIAASQYYFNDMIYPEIAYLRNTFHLSNIHSNDSIFIKKKTDYYYKRLYPMGKLMDANFVITEDCFEESEQNNLIDEYILFYYSLYNTIKLPANYINRLKNTAEENSPFLSKYYALRTIYFLKKFNYKQLSEVQKNEIEKLNNKISKDLYTNYINNKDWSFYKIVALSILMMNNNELVKDINIDFLINYYLENGQPTTNILDIPAFPNDTKDDFLVKQFGIDKVIQLQTINVLWIFLNKKITLISKN